MRFAVGISRTFKANKIAAAPVITRADEGSVQKLRVSAPKARNVIAWAIGPGGTPFSFLALKARNDVGSSTVTIITVDDYYFAPSALPKLTDLNLGRCPRLLHFAPLALTFGGFTASLEARR